MKLRKNCNTNTVGLKDEREQS